MTDKALEAALKAAEPDLFSDNHEVAHKAASPLKVDVARDEWVAKIKAAISAYLSALPGEAYADLLNRQTQTDPDIVAATAKNRSSLYSALPGEVEVVATAWEGYWPGAGSVSSVTRVTKDKRTAEAWASDGAEVTPLVTLASYQSLQARAEKAERERDHWKANHAEMVQRNAVLRERPDLPADRLPSIARYEARVKELEEALEPFAAITEIPALGCVTKDMVITARTALKGGSNG